MFCFDVNARNTTKVGYFVRDVSDGIEDAGVGEHEVQQGGKLLEEKQTGAW